MTAHLQFMPAPPPSPSTQPRSARGPSGGPDDFAALLDPTATAAPTATADETTEPDAKAVARDFLDALRDLEAALDAGDDPDSELLDQLRDDANALGQTLAEAQKPADLVQSLAGVAGFAAAILAPALTPVVAAATPLVEAVTGTQPAAPSADLSRLAEKLQAVADRLATTDGELSAKLAALADQLGSGKLSQVALDRIGLRTPAGDIDQSLQALLATKPPAAAPKAETAAATPALPVPQLGQPTSAGDAPEAAPAPVTIDKAAAPQAARVDHQPPTKAEAVNTPSSNTPPDLATNSTDAPDAPPPQPPSGQQAPSAQATTAPKLLPAAYQTPQVNLPQLAFEIARQFHQGSSRFEVRLDPPELGRIDLRMHVDAAGNLNARLTVERSETLDMFQRDQRGLERALQQAGLDGAKTNLEFSLRQGPFERPTGGAAPQFSAARGPLVAEAEPVQPAITLYRGTASAGGVNIFV